VSQAVRERPGVNRRELLGTLARWTVPTVVTMTLGARVLEAKASCPPCQRKVGAVCRACTISQMLNCQCEPCLGAPYCAGSLMAAPSVQGAPGSQQLLRPTPGSTTPGAPGGLTPAQQLQMERARAVREPFSQPMYRDPFGGQRPMQPQGLYERLRPDSLSRRP